MSLARDVGSLLSGRRKKRAKTLPPRLPRGFGDELLAREYAEAMARHRAALAELRAARRLQGADARAQCRDRVAGARARAWEIYRAAQEVARARRRGEIAAVATECRVDRLAQAAPLAARIAEEQAALAERRRERRAYLQRERSSRKKSAARGSTASTARTRDAETRGAVRYALEVEAPELVALWDRVGPSIKGSPRRSLREAFLDWAQEHPEEVQAAREEAAAARTRETIAEMEREQRQAYEEQQAARKRRTRQKKAAAADEVPF